MPDSDAIEAALRPLLDAFYAKVRQDALIGPVFIEAVHDWPEHLARIADFWSSVMLSSGRYKGDPVAKHMAHASRLTPEMFDRWLAIWAETTNDLLAPPVAQALQGKARRIAESLQLAIRYPSPTQRELMKRSHHDTR
ncbi:MULTISPECIES: group III truncated hemoglobin [Sphingomonas]|jgi:hemoglobin|uniref:Preprotein translocase subunit TatC n=1 Tax=Sphingomonas turrisvirgatae TaxID=1888892 RepID=A0A1E3LYI9_9SPHN|nr:group III truncated hemoglobin [Sphingomonas turrisvirgatae]ODP38811.1 preprotein translocase subunit TatC [Sphingomonas turrisvirgatae]